MFKNFFLKESNMLWAIGINAIVIFLLYFPNLNPPHPKGEVGHLSALEWVDYFFVVLFLVEAIVKISHYGWSGYWKEGWNKFDFLIVLVSFPALLSPFVALGKTTSFLKILRLSRMIRLLRLMSFIPRMAIIMEGLVRALKASVFVMIALTFLNFILALFTCHFFAKISPEYFADPAISMYSIFKMFTVEGWYEIPDSIAVGFSEKGYENASILIGASRFYFIIVVLLGGIFGMSLANAVFVDEMTSDNNSVVEDKIDNLEKQIAELKSLLVERNP